MFIAPILVHDMRGGGRNGYYLCLTGISPVIHISLLINHQKKTDVFMLTVYTSGQYCIYNVRGNPPNH